MQERISGKTGNPETPDISRLCIHTITTKPWPIERAVEAYAAAGVGGISVWREATKGRDLPTLRRRIADAGLTGVSYVRGGFFADAESEKRKAALSENRRAIAEAAELGLPLLVIVPGSDPRQSLTESRKQIADALATLAPFAADSGVVLGIEPLHPMYADTRSAINSLATAMDMVEELSSPAVTVVIDVYHLWWEPDLPGQITRAAAADALAAFHVCDWKVPTEHMLTDRGLMGEGCIPIADIRDNVEAAGFDGFIEVEVFSQRYWEMDQRDFLQMIIEAYRTGV